MIFITFLLCYVVRAHRAAECFTHLDHVRPHILLSSARVLVEAGEKGLSSPNHIGRTKTLLLPNALGKSWAKLCTPQKIISPQILRFWVNCL